MTATVLVVDDEPDLETLILRKFRKQVRDGGISFLFAHDGVDALQAIEQHPHVDLLVMDINMPRMDGLSLLAKLQEREDNKSAIIVSAYGDMSNIRTAMNRGAFDFLTVQLGTAFIGCGESAADAVYRMKLNSARHTRMTSVVSGRPTRILDTEFADLIGARGRPAIPDYPSAYDAGKSLSVAARTAGIDGLGVFWAGQGVSLARSLPAADLVRALMAEADLYVG